MMECDDGSFMARIMPGDGRAAYDEKDIRATLSRHLVLRAGETLQKSALQKLSADYEAAVKANQDVVDETDELRAGLAKMMGELEGYKKAHGELEFATMAQQASNKMLRGMPARLEAEAEAQRVLNAAAIAGIRASRNSCAAELVAAQADLEAAEKELVVTRRQCSTLVAQAEGMRRKTQAVQRQCCDVTAEAERASASALADAQLARKKAERAQGDAAAADALAEQAREQLRVSEALAADAVAQAAAATDKLRAALDDDEKLAKELAVAKGNAEAAKGAACAARADMIASEKSREALSAAARATEGVAAGMDKELAAVTSRIAGLRASLQSATSQEARVRAEVQRLHTEMSWMQDSLAQRCMATIGAMQYANRGHTNTPRLGEWQGEGHGPVE